MVGDEDGRLLETRDAVDPHPAAELQEDPEPQVGQLLEALFQRSHAGRKRKGRASPGTGPPWGLLCSLLHTVRMIPCGSCSGPASSWGGSCCSSWPACSSSTGRIGRPHPPGRKSPPMTRS